MNTKSKEEKGNKRHDKGGKGKIYSEGKEKGK